MSPLKWISSTICDKNLSRPLEPINTIFSDLPEVIYDTNMFTNGIKAKIGILILYDDAHNSYLEQLVNQIKQTDYIVDILVIQS